MADGSKAKSGSKDYYIDLENFRKRLKVFYDYWNDNRSDPWGSVDTITIAIPSFSKDGFSKSSAFELWLLGYEFPETIIVFMQKEIHFLCSPKRANLIGTLKSSANEVVGADIVLHVITKHGDISVLMDQILHAACAHAKSGTPVVGQIAKQAHVGKLLETWAKKLAQKSLKLIDVTNGFSEILAVKDAKEILSLKMSASLSAGVMTNFVIPKLKKVIDEGRKVTHLSLMDATEGAIRDPSKANLKLNANNVDICYRPFFQSGGKFALKPTASSNDDDYLYHGSASIIICSIGSKYSEYCSNISRSFLINATRTQHKAYETLLKAHDAAIAACIPGNQMNAVYLTAVQIFQKEAPQFLDNLTRSAGNGIGLEFCESGLNLNARNNRLIKHGMVFNISLGLHNIDAKTRNEKTNQFSLLLADTVLASEIPKADLNHDKLVNILTYCSKAIEDVAYPFGNHHQDGALPQHKRRKVDPFGHEAMPNKATFLSDNLKASKKALRRKDLAALVELKNEETARLAGGGSGSGVGIQEKLPATSKWEESRLNDVWIRPAFDDHGKEMPGILETKLDSFKYSIPTAGATRVDIMYENVKHAFFQPADKESFTLIHFHLHNEVMVGKKKTKDVQFYVEVMDAAKTSGCNIGSTFHHNDIEDQRERCPKNKVNLKFQKYVNMVNHHWSQPQMKGLDLKFEIPLRGLGFHGIPYKVSALIMPTWTCLVELTETPFLVVALNEIEIVNLERVHEENFDMAIVFKDFEKDVLRIDCIPVTSLIETMEWLDIMGLKYYQTRRNQAWLPIQLTLRHDTKKFMDDGGWVFLSNMEAGNSETETEESHESKLSESLSEDEDANRASLVVSDKDQKSETLEDLEREASNVQHEVGAAKGMGEEITKRCKVKTFSKPALGPGVGSGMSVMRKPRPGSGNKNKPRPGRVSMSKPRPPECGSGSSSKFHPPPDRDSFQGGPSKKPKIK